MHNTEQVGPVLQEASEGGLPALRGVNCQVHRQRVVTHKLQKLVVRLGPTPVQQLVAAPLQGPGGVLHKKA